MTDFGHLSNFFLDDSDYEKNWKPNQDLLFPGLIDTPPAWCPVISLFSDKMPCSYLGDFYLVGEKYDSFISVIRSLGEDAYVMVNYNRFLVHYLHYQKGIRFQPPNYVIPTNLKFADIVSGSDLPPLFWCLEYLPHAYLMYGKRNDWAVIGDEGLGLSLLAVKPEIYSHFAPLACSDDLMLRAYFSGMDTGFLNEPVPDVFFRNYFTQHRHLFTLLRDYVPTLFYAFQERFGSDRYFEGNTFTDLSRRILACLVTTDTFDSLLDELQNLMTTNLQLYKAFFGDQNLDAEFRQEGGSKMYRITNLLTNLIIVVVVSDSSDRLTLSDIFVDRNAFHFDGPYGFNEYLNEFLFGG